MKRNRIIYNAALWREIDKRRAELGLSVSEFCSKARISRVAWYRYAKGMGMYPPTVRRLLSLMDALERDAREQR